MLVWQRLLDAIDRSGKAAMATIVETRGSAPREAGARIVVMPDASFFGTIGGGTLEWKVIADLQARLARSQPRLYEHRSVALGPELGQCCGGRIDLALEMFDASRRAEVAALAGAEAQGSFQTRATLGENGALERVVEPAATVAIGSVALEGDAILESFGESRRPLYLFGAGHVGRALVLALAPLPFRIVWVDNRAEAFPARVPANVACVQPDDVAAVLDIAPTDSFVLVMSHSHTLDQEIVDRALRRDVFPYVGVIGSATKRARFRSRLAQAGLTPEALDKMICPIGIPGIRSKLPAVIGASVTADLLIRDEALRRQHPEFGPSIPVFSSYSKRGR
jgi:xanthine dehydrogenase accessory factor